MAEAAGTIAGGGPIAYFNTPMIPNAISMGNTGVADSISVFSAYYNPANAGFQKANELFKLRMGIIGSHGTYGNILSSDHLIQVLGAVEFHRKSWSYNLMYLEKQIGNYYTSKYQESSGMIILSDIKLSVNQRTLNLSGAQKRSGLVWGWAVRACHDNISKDKIFMGGGDVGILYSIDNDENNRLMNFGIMYRYLRNNDSLQSSENIFRTGVSGLINTFKVNFDISAGDFTPLTLGFGAKYSVIDFNVGKIEISAGNEYQYYNEQEDLSLMAVGLCLIRKTLELNISYTLPLIDQHILLVTNHELKISIQAQL